MRTSTIDHNASLIHCCSYCGNVVQRLPFNSTHRYNLMQRKTLNTHLYGLRKQSDGGCPKPVNFQFSCRKWVRVGWATPWDANMDAEPRNWKARVGISEVDDANTSVCQRSTSQIACLSVCHFVAMRCILKGGKNVLTTMYKTRHFTRVQSAFKSPTQYRWRYGTELFLCISCNGHKMLMMYITAVEAIRLCYLQHCFDLWVKKPMFDSTHWLDRTKGGEGWEQCLVASCMRRHLFI